MTGHVGALRDDRVLDHSHIACARRSGQKGDLCIGKVAAMIKLDNTKALKALGLRPTDGFNVEDNASADSYDDVTMGEYAPAPEVDSKEHAPQRRAAETFTFPTVRSGRPISCLNAAATSVLASQQALL